MEEAQEEVVCRPPLQLQPSSLLMLGDFGAFEGYSLTTKTNATTQKREKRENVESSTVFLLPLPPRSKLLHFHELVRGKPEQAAPLPMTLQSAIEAYKINPTDFSDGATRVLGALCENNGLMEEMKRLLKNICAPTPSF